MLKILHINCACTGSTGKIISDIADYSAGAGCQSILCAPCMPGTNPNIRYYRTSLPYEQGIYRRLNYLYGFQYGFAPVSTVRIKKVIQKERPALIHIHCANGFMVNVYSLFQYIKKQGIPVVITNHAEFYYTGGCPHAYDCQRWLTGCGQCPQKTAANGSKIWDTSAAAWKRMQKAFTHLEKAVMVSVSPWVQERAMRSPITAALRHKMVLNGVNTNTFLWRDPTSLREKHGFSKDTRIIFHPTASFSNSPRDRKGGHFVLELARRMMDENVVFVVAGKCAQGVCIPDNLILLGHVSDQEKLAEYYSMADLTLVTGKRETFNMPVAESLCCGTPVVGFLAGGPESVAIEQYSRFVEYGNMTDLQASVQELLGMSYDKQIISKQGKEKYSAVGMAQQYLSIYRELTTEGIG